MQVVLNSHNRLLLFIIRPFNCVIKQPPLRRRTSLSFSSICCVRQWIPVIITIRNNIYPFYSQRANSTHHGNRHPSSTHPGYLTRSLARAKNLNETTHLPLGPFGKLQYVYTHILRKVALHKRITYQ